VVAVVTDVSVEAVETVVAVDAVVCVVTVVTDVSVEAVETVVAVDVVVALVLLVLEVVDVGGGVCDRNASHPRICKIPTSSEISITSPSTTAISSSFIVSGPAVEMTSLFFLRVAELEVHPFP
jgi:hypothetical protein